MRLRAGLDYRWLANWQPFSLAATVFKPELAQAFDLCEFVFPLAAIFRPRRFAFSLWLLWQTTLARAKARVSCSSDHPVGGRVL
jgi:hypothetical protein